MPEMNTPAPPGSLELPSAVQLFDAHPQAQWLVDVASQRVLAVNREALRLTGLSRAQFMACRAAEIRPLHADITAADLSVNGRPAQLVVACATPRHEPSLDALADQMRLDATAGGFDFGKFGHGEIRLRRRDADLSRPAPERQPTPSSRMLSFRQTKS